MKFFSFGVGKVVRPLLFFFYSFTGNGLLLLASLRKQLLNHVPRFEDDAENEQLQSHSKARGRHKNACFVQLFTLLRL